MKTSELRKQVRETLKEMGLTTKDISVSVKCTGLSDKIEVRGKHENVPFKEIESALNKFVAIDRCQSSGEILSGGNTFLFVYHPDGYTRRWND